MAWAEKRALLSSDPNTKVGSVVLDFHRSLIGIGWNRFPSGIEENIRIMDRELKNRLMIHAEVASLLHCQGLGRYLVVTFAPCDRCAGQIIDHGVKEVVYKENPGNDYERRWQNSVEFGFRLFQEAGVYVHAIGKKEPWLLGRPFPS